MPRTILHIPRLDLVENTELLASCNCCGIANYIVDHSEPDPTKAYRLSGVRLWDLRISPNGVQTFITKFCRDCLEAMQEKAFQVLLDHPETDRDALSQRLEDRRRPWRALQG